MLINRASKIYQGLSWKCPSLAYITMPQGRGLQGGLMVCTGGAQQVQHWAQQPGSEEHMSWEESSRPRASEALQTWLICSRAVLSIILLQLRPEFRWQLHQTCHYCVSYREFWPKKEFMKWSINSYTFFSLNNLSDTEEITRNTYSCVP